MLDCEENAEDIVRNAATHENRMVKIYDAYDKSLAQAWRRP